MRLARIRMDDTAAYAVADQDGYHLVEGDIFGDWKKTDRVLPADSATLLAPVEPPQIIAIGLNYRRHAKESGMELPDHPLIFVKTLNTITGPGMPIVLPKMAPAEVDFEAELALVIGKRTRNVSEDDALDCLLGYTCAQDVSARDCQLRFDKQWARGKCFDTFAPIGPWIETDLDGDNAGIRLTVNGQTMQNSNTADMIFGCRQLVSYVSQCMTLLPGSIILTGTPEGVGFSRKPPIFLKAGDTTIVEIEGIGALTNTVEMED
ncbi:hypothetical protein LCGC14_0204430 [marine sediment metagenome]|uniref:Fumarylacetoacetase-like C-terminal domain-containing protein n=1 Tax=marine sediment metagenome TaxID=412755 RepID=A0A0F9XLC3_9ZZZZ|nr:DUF2437 domain-containing protein [Phycisphaerae bacterium]